MFLPVNHLLHASAHNLSVVLVRPLAGCNPLGRFLTAAGLTPDVINVEAMSIKLSLMSPCYFYVASAVRDSFSQICVIAEAAPFVMENLRFTDQLFGNQLCRMHGVAYLLESAIAIC